MKQNFVRMKTRAKTVSLRTLALVMGLVMLLSAVGVGSTLSAFALTNDGSGDQAASLSAAADLGTGIADTATQLKPTLPAYANASLRGDKVDLAGTGATYYIWKSESGGNSASQYTCLGTSPQTFSATTGRNYYIAVSTSGTDISSGTVWLDGANVSGVSTSTTGTQGFDGKQAVYFAMASANTVKVSYSSGSKIKIEKGTSSSSCTTDHKMIVTGSKQLTNTTNWQNTWSGAGTRNQMTYNSAIGKYEIKYTNIDASKSSSDYFRFRILDLTQKGDPDTSWETDKGFAQGSGAITDASNILQGTSKTTAGDDNTFQFSLKQKANITIYLDDSKLDTNSAIEVIVNPAVSTVTAGSAMVNDTVTAAAGTITVSNGTNVPYGGTVNLTAAAGTDYVFSQWEDNSSLSYANKNAATTTATVTGSTTVNAIFVPKSYMLTRGTGTGYTITAPTTASSSKQWGTNVTITANTDDMHYIDYLYYKVNNEGDEVKIGDNAGSNATTLTRTLSMPKSNVTVYAKVHERASNTITYGYCTGSEGLGYINVGKRHGTSTSQIEYTIDSGDNVLEGTEVLLGARPISSKKFVGWYSNQAGSDNSLVYAGGKANQDRVITPTANTTLYAKFADAPNIETLDPYLASDKVTLFIASSSKDVYIYTWNGGDIGTSWPGYKSSNDSDYVTIGGQKYMKVQTAKTSFSLQLNHGNNQNQSNDYTFSGTLGSGYYLSYGGNGQNVTKTNYTSQATSTPDPDKASTTYYPVKLNITNPDKGVADSTYLSNYFCARSSSVNVYAKPSDTTNMKTSIKKLSGSSDTTEVIKWSTAYSSMTMNASATSATATVTFIPKEYYTVNFSAGPNGTVTATAGGKAITSGTKVQEDTSVQLTATPNSGYSFSKWTGSSNSTSSPLNVIIDGNKDYKAWFKNSDKGTKITSTDYYFVYGTSNNYQTWESSKDLYHKGGRVYAYFDTCTVGTDYYFSISSAAKPKDAFNGSNLAAGLYGWNKSNSKAVTDFTQYITASQQNWKVKWNYQDGQGDLERGTVYYGKATPKTGTKGFMVDVGEWKNGTYEYNEVYRVIPIYEDDVTNVDIYAKDGSYRGDSSFDVFPAIADTELTGATNIQHQSEFDTGTASRGDTITVKTTINSDNKAKYYVRGFSFNGVTPELYDADTSTGEYTCTYKIPDDFEYDYLEITPIYYRVNDTSSVKFYIENYDKALEAEGWGNTISVYPYYQDAAGNYAEDKRDNAFGGYPGQPLIFYGGRRFIEIPTTYTVGSTTYNIKGVTLSNDYWDVVHREYAWAVSEHLQTYDYDDFYKIYKETSDGKEINGRHDDGAADQITFAFKYRDDTNNFADSSQTATYSNTGKTVKAPYDTFTVDEKTSKFGNDWEPLLDYHDRPIDIFGKQLTSEQQTEEPLLIVSDDYAINYVGRYATTWTVYYKDGSTYRKIAEIAPSALIVTEKGRLSDSTYPVVTDADGLPNTEGTKLPDYADEYEALLTYKEKPALITYESAIQNNSSYAKFWEMTKGKSEIATRNDGRWFYSYMNEEISANLRIDYTDEYTGETTDWTTDTFKGNTGNVTGATVHFTNTASDATGGNYELTPYHDTADYNGKIYSNFNHYYKFVATEGSGYIFQGWYMERDGISTAVNADDIKKLNGQSQMTSNATFVARYVKNPAGHITINHTLDDGSTGTGTTYIGIEKSTDGTNWTWITGDGTNHYERVDKVSVNDPDVMSYNSGYTLRVTLKTEVEPDTAFDRFSANNDDHSPNYFSSDVDTSGTTSTTSFEVPVDDLFQIVDGFPKQQFDTLTYFSHTTKRPELTINHNIDPTSDSTAEGDTYVKVEVLSAGGAIVETYGGNETDGYAKGKDLVIPSTYYNGTDDYRIKVYLKTEMKGFTQFDHFSILGYVITNAAGPNGETITLSSSTDQRTKFATATFSAAACYNRGQHVLPYLSKLVVPDYKYQLKYTYPSYVKEYNNQSYTAKDSFAPEELTEYMTLNNGDLAFQDDGKKLSFICLKAPYEDNYQKTLDFSKNSTITGRGYNSTDYTMQLDISVNAENKQLSAYFDFPYATTQSNEFKPVVTDGKVVKTDPNRQGKTDIYGRDWFVTNDVRHEGIEGTPEFVKAPLIIYDGNKPMYFKYWSVKTEATDTNKSVTYTRCYDYEFNLAIFQNCIITPEYDEIDFAARGMAAPSSTYDDYGRFDPDVNRKYYALDGNGISITFIETSRNQYNNGDSGIGVPNNRSGAADRLFCDFLLTFDNDPKIVLRDTDAGQKQAGLIIQPVAYLEKDANNEYVVEDDTYYASASGYGGLTPDEVKSRIEAGDFSGLAKSQFDVGELDNKNRRQYYYGLNNAAPKKSTDAADADGILRVGEMNNNHAIVYKAFAYIGDGNGTSTLTNVIVGSQPVYFTVYTDAMIAPGHYMPSTASSGN